MASHPRLAGGHDRTQVVATIPPPVREQRSGRLLSAFAEVVAVLESAHSGRVLAGITGALVALIGVAATTQVAPAEAAGMAGATALTALAVGVALGTRRSSVPLVESAITIGLVGLVTWFSALAHHATPTVVWLYAWVVPVIGLVRGPVAGMLAGGLSALALHWIETGVFSVSLVDLQVPFGVLILAALGAVPGQMLSSARARRAVLAGQLQTIEGLLGESNDARAAETAMREQAVLMLARSAEARDGTTGIHIQQVADLAQELAAATGLAPTEAGIIGWSAMLHDIGKLRVPDHVLLKPGKLDEDEWALIRRHPVWGEEILKGAEGFGLARAIARSHHENWDGSGYPDGIGREAIPFAARIVRIVDVFDALCSERPYKPAWDVEQALDELRSMRGTGLDPELADLFIALQGG